MVKYRIVIKSTEGETLGEIENFKDLRFKHVLNREGDCSFKVSIKDPKLTAAFVMLGLREVYIYRNHDIVWGGILLNDSGSISGGDDMVTFRAFGFLWYAKSWKINGVAEYTTTDFSDIAWDLFEYGQGKDHGDRGITEGTLAASPPRDKMFDNKSVYDALIALSEIQDGIDFEVTQTKAFNTYYTSKGTDKSNSVSFVFGENLSRLDYTNDFTNPMNRAFVHGGGFGEAMSVVQTEDVGLQESYGLYEDFVPYKDVEEEDLLEAKGDYEIVRRGLPRREYTPYQIPETNPVWNTLTTGDWVRLVAEHGFKSIADSVRINAIEVGVDGGIESPSYSFKYD